MTRDEMIAAITALQDDKSGLQSHIVDLQNSANHVNGDIETIKRQLNAMVLQSKLNAELLTNINRIVAAGGLMLSVIKVCFAIVVGVTTLWVAIVNLNANGAFDFVNNFKWK